MAETQRPPIPTRTRRGHANGAKTQVTIDYYCAPDGVGQDRGVFYGRDDDGAWELHFDGREELVGQLDRVIANLNAVATEAREETAEDRAAGRTVWLKAIGATGDPIGENWSRDPRRDGGVDFPYRPKSVKDGDLLVLYGATTGKVVGVERVVGDWYEGNRHPRWRYRVNTELLAHKPLSEGVPLESLNDERALGKSIRQKSHVRLTEREAAAALQAFDLA